ncbi:MAG: tRNA lysidine(34) synthetase TilS [Lachnospiraceae bacterium]|nr:tRNA lysidine(34) synthetase TilS [Lachnospiraceae bacterium]
MQKLPLRVLRYCRENQLIGKGEKIIAGVSGGADSVCLFYVLKELRELLEFELFAVHIEHGIREENSKRDEGFVRALCNKEGIPLLVYNEDAPEYARKNSLSLEEAARALRYADFEKARNELSADKIAVAHHLNDQAETLLFHLIRGSGLTGLTGMRPERGRIIRPLLFLKRAEIESYVSENAIEYVVDETNSDVTYSRNRIRRELIPTAERISPEAVSHICRVGERIAEAEEFIEKQANVLYTKCVVRVGGGTSDDSCFEVDIPKLLKGEKILRGYVVKRLLTEYYRGGKDLTATHIEDILGLCEKQSGRRIVLPKGVIALRAGERLKLGRFQERETPRELLLKLSGDTSFDERFLLTCKTFDYDASEGIPQKTYTKWFDYDKIIASARLRGDPELCVRTRRGGDRIAVDKRLSEQTLKKYFTNEKIPVDERDGIPLIALGNDIVWVIGYRISERYKLDSDTKRVLEIRAVPEENTVRKM